MGNDAIRLDHLPAATIEVVLGPGGLIRGPVPVVGMHAGLKVAEDTVFQGYKPHGEEVSIEDVRLLTEEEVVDAPLPTTPNGGGTSQGVRALRYQHHEIARLLAAGTKPSEIANILDITVPTISRLIATPQFQDLLHGYTIARDKAAVDLGARMKVGAAIAVDKLIEKMEGVPGTVLPADWLTKTALGLADRVGHAPIQRSVHASVTAAVTPAEIRAMRAERARQTLVLAPHSPASPAGQVTDVDLSATGPGSRDGSVEAPGLSPADAMARDEARSRPVVPEPS